MAVSIITGYVFERSGCQLMARMVGNAGAFVTQASLSSITYKLFDLSSATPDTTVASGTVTISGNVYDTVQTPALDPRWTRDSIGYNFRYAAPGSWFTPGDHVFRIEFTFTPTSGEVFYALFQPTARNLLSHA